MKIEFYIPKDEKIPTQLRVKVDDKIDVYYDALPDTFGWSLKFFKHQGVTSEMVNAITDEIVHLMSWQSYDHGAYWKERGVREIKEEDYIFVVNVYFRVRDAG